MFRYTGGFVLFRLEQVLGQGSRGANNGTGGGHAIGSQREEGKHITGAFEGEFHIPVIVLIERTSMHVMHVEKIKERELAVFLPVFCIVLEDNGYLK